MGKWHLGDYRISFQRGTGLITGSDCPTPTIWIGSARRPSMWSCAPSHRMTFLNWPVDSKRQSIPLPTQKKPIGMFRCISIRTQAGIRDDLVESDATGDADEATNEEANRFISEHKDQPFFLYVPYAIPHLPPFASEAFAGTSLRGPYGDVVSEIDWSAGRFEKQRRSPSRTKRWSFSPVIMDLGKQSLRGMLAAQGRFGVKRNHLGGWR